LNEADDEESASKPQENDSIAKGAENKDKTKNHARKRKR